MKVTILLFFIAVTNARLISRELAQYEFQAFKQKYNRHYYDEFEENYRFDVFYENLEFIHGHNLKAANGLKSYTLAVNNFTDFTLYEFVSTHNGYRKSKQTKSVEYFKPTFSTLPSSVDWRTKGVVTPVKNQGLCGSCWAFSAVASMEGQHALKTKNLVSLSEQNLVDCSGPEGNLACGGGEMDAAFQYVIQNKGIDTEQSYPYVDAFRFVNTEKCLFKSNNVGANITSYKDIPSGDELALQEVVATVGPISVAIDANHLSFQFYFSGVYDNSDCSTTNLDHGVTAVGYGTLNGKDYWLVKNSWGTYWGEKGYVLMSRNKNNQCGIATSASYPVV